MNKKTNFILSVFIPLLLSVSIIFGFSACNKNDQLNEISDPSNDHIDQEILDNTFYNQYGTHFMYEKFYGTYEDAQTFFVAGDETALKYVSIAGSIFKYNTLWEIYVFNNSKFYKLKEAYSEGVLSGQAVYELSKVHADYVKAQRNESDDDFNAWYYNTEDIQDTIN